MKKIFQYIIGTIAAILIVAVSASAQTVFTPKQGGTGTGTRPSAGQILIGTSGNIYTPAYLTPGSNVTISTSSGAITISATGGGGGSGTISSSSINTVAYYTASSTLNGTSSLTFNPASGTLQITGPAGTSTLTIGTSTKQACQQARDSDDNGWTKSSWKGGILFVENTICQ